MALRHGNPAHLLNPNYKTEVTRWLAEDCPSFDYGGFVVGDAEMEARLLGKSEGVLAGVPFFDEVFRQVGCTVEWHIKEGSTISSPRPMHAATVRGPVRQILLGERVALNTLARCSGIATATSQTLSLLQFAAAEQQQPQTQTQNTDSNSHEPHCPILAGTRKTTPGFRLVEKYGMLVGGADPHRHDLSAMTMLKDNHVWACGGSIAKAVRAAKAAGGFAVKVEVECQSEAEAGVAIQAGADVVMLDNFSSAEAVGVAVKGLRARFGGGGGGGRESREGEEGGRRESREGEGGGEGVLKGARPDGGFLIEVSGGLTRHNLAAYARSGVDVLSTSSIHQGVAHVDFSLKIVH